MLSTAQPTCFLIADISGYTGYLADVELDHAQDILADLIGAVVTRAPAELPAGQARGRRGVHVHDRRDAIDGSMLLDTIERCYFGFRRRRRDVRQATSCECNACVADPRPRPQVRRPPRRGHPPEGRRAPGAARVGRDRRPPAAQERRRRGRWASTPTPCSARPASTPSGPRPGRARHAPAHRDLRPDRRRPGLGARPGASLAGGGGARRVFVDAGGGHPRPLGADRACRRRSPGSSSPSPASGCPGSRG